MDDSVTTTKYFVPLLPLDMYYPSIIRTSPVPALSTDPEHTP